MKSNVIRLVKNPLTWLVLIILVGFLVRTYKIDNPIADWHSWRQADSAAVPRNFYQEGFNPFVPIYDDMSGVAEKPIANPNRYRLVEFPISGTLTYLAFSINGGVDERLARLVSVLFSLGSIIFLYLITKRYLGVLTALIASFVFAFLPFNIYFSRVVLPEPALVFFCLGMFFTIDSWIKNNSWKTYFGAIFFTACAFLTKPMAIFYLLPLLYSYRLKEGRWWPVPRRYVYLLIPAFLPFIFWRVWIGQHPEGIPASNWLFNGNGIRFKPAFWRWIISDRFGREILSVAGTVLFTIGLLKRSDTKEGWTLHLLGLSMLAYLIVFATGNVQHDYYQVLIIPALAIFVARGFLLLMGGINGFIPRIWTIPLALLFIVLTFYLSWVEVRGFYQINNPVIVEAGRFADRILPKEAVVIAPYQGDTAFLYQVNRPGWPVVALPTQELIDSYGVTHYISINYDDKTNWLMERYPTIEQNPKFIILDLREMKPEYIKSPNTKPEPAQ